MFAGDAPSGQAEWSVARFGRSRADQRGHVSDDAFAP
jgi:hypothetical protein